MIYFIGVVASLLASANAKVYFKENFNDKAWESRWTVPSDWKSKVGVLQCTH